MVQRIVALPININLCIFGGHGQEKKVIGGECVRNLDGGERGA